MTQMPVKKKHKHKKHKKELGKEGLFHESQGKRSPHMRLSDLQFQYLQNVMFATDIARNPNEKLVFNPE